MTNCLQSVDRTQKILIFSGMKTLLSLTVICFALSINLIAQAPAEKPKDVCDLEPVMKSFSPNGDGEADVFQVKSACVLQDFSFKLFNRWGSSLFETTNQNFVWNGEEKKDKLVDPGTYFYLVSYFLNGEKKEISGFVNIYY